MPDRKDSITNHEWVGMVTMMTYICKEAASINTMMMDNADGGLAYLAALSMLQDNVYKLGMHIEDILKVRTHWLYPKRQSAQEKGRFDVGKSADDYYYHKLLSEVNNRLEEINGRNREGEPVGNCVDTKSNGKGND